MSDANTPKYSEASATGQIVPPLKDTRVPTCVFCGETHGRFIANDIGALCIECVKGLFKFLCDDGTIVPSAYLFRVRKETACSVEHVEFAAIDFIESPKDTILSREPLFRVASEFVFNDVCAKEKSE